MIIGGALNVMAETGAINGALGHVVTKVKGREMLLIPVMLTIMTCLSTFAGCSEEYIAFVPLIMAVSYALGFDSIVAVALPLAAVSGGYGAGVTNAFTVGVAQGICGLPMFSGMGLRAVLFVVMNIVTIPYVMWYANKVRKNPELSTVREEDLLYNSHLKLQETPVITLRHKLVLVLFVATIATVVLGVLSSTSTSMKWPDCSCSAGSWPASSGDCPPGKSRMPSWPAAATCCSPTWSSACATGRC